jgi:hypothetical protein
MRSIALFLIVFGAGCGVGTSLPGGGPTPSQPTDPPTGLPLTGASWNGVDFVVHEWGTNTIVVGSDGTMQRGLHHEEEDLPAFVYDRVKAGRLPGSASVEVKMETPVLYFYSPTPRTEQVAVEFPAGVMTQWYPAVAGFYPPIATPDGDPADALDPVLDVQFPFHSAQCVTDYRKIGQGRLDWGSVDVLGRDEVVALPDAPLDHYTWSHARAVAANAVRVSGVPGADTAAQAERFLFYRGLGNFALPVAIDAGYQGKWGSLGLTNQGTQSVGAVVTIDVAPEGGAFHVYPAGLAPGGALTDDVRGQAHQALDAYAADLGAAITQALDGTGLYHDEAVAMVSTWSRQWFRTPGTRVLYLAPQPWTEAQLPLHLDPPPASLVRVMMIRVEVITPDEENLDGAALAAYLTDPAGAQAHFQALGRFAEPRLRNAVRLAGDPSWAQPLVALFTSADTRVAAGE